MMGFVDQRATRVEEQFAQGGNVEVYNLQKETNR